MEEIRNFYDLEVWRQGHKLVLQIYKVTGAFPYSEQFGITSQLRRAASSITANVSEGFERFHFRDKIKFYYQARGSIAEVQNFLILSRDLGYIKSECCKSLGESANSIRKLLNGLIRSAENQCENSGY